MLPVCHVCPGCHVCPACPVCPVCPICPSIPSVLAVLAVLVVLSVLVVMPVLPVLSVLSVPSVPSVLAVSVPSVCLFGGPSVDPRCWGCLLWCSGPTLSGGAVAQGLPDGMRWAHASCEVVPDIIRPQATQNQAFLSIHVTPRERTHSKT